MAAPFVEDLLFDGVFFYNNFASKLILCSLFPSFAETDDTFFSICIDTRLFLKKKQILSHRNNSIH
jgi:hypothetical protein